jgi:hypothetical protein
VHFLELETKRKTMTEREVWYILVNGTGRETADKVRVSRTGDISDFRDAVHAKNPRKVAHCDPSDLVVYANKAAFERKDNPLGSRDKLGEELGRDDELYVVVPATSEDVKRQKVEVSDVWMKDLKEKLVEVPEDINALRAFLQNELRVKIPLSHEFIQLISVLDTQKLCAEVSEKLFAASLAMSRTTTTMVNQVIDPEMSQSEHATEDTYHHLWDSLIATVLTRVSYGCFLRNSNKSTSTRLCHPDLCFYYNKLNICVFRGEEKADGELIVPLNELHEKLDKWIYDDAPYLLGYAAVGLQVELAIIQKDEGGKATVQMVEHYDLGSLVGRLRLFLAMLNLSTLFRPLVDKVKRRFVRPEYGVLKKENGVEIQLGTVNVIKKYPSEMPTSLVHAVIDHLKLVHSLMSSRSVPNVIQLVRSNMKKKTVCLTPVGYPEVPKDLKELVRALLDILDALVSMHQLKIVHRDLRWDNILRYCSGGQNWFIIDFDDSAQLTKEGRDWIIHQAKDAQDMDPASHAPELYNSTHDEKVDIWSIGYLIQTSHLNLSPEVIKVKNDCMQDNPKKRPTALVLQRRFQKILGTFSLLNSIV